MKHILKLCLVLLIPVGFCYGQTGSITGQVTYANYANTVLHDSTTVLLYRNDTLISSVDVDSNGFYEFTNLPSGTYKVKSICSKKWGGGNSSDALKILTHFVGLYSLSGIHLIAADVNMSGGTPGSVDALAVARRFVGMITSFAPSPDWVSTKHTLSITPDTQITQNILMLCMGDVNASNIPN
ncbi:MAG: hypothetical protein AB9842_07590 [Bacteroidales bacterium]